MFLPPGAVGTSTWHIVAPQSVIATVVIISGPQSRGPLVTWSPRRPTKQSFILFHWWAATRSLLYWIILLGKGGDIAQGSEIHGPNQQ